MIEFINVSKKYDRYLFKNFSFKFLNKGFYVIKGKSGSGKSTILNMISGLEKDFEGDIKINNKSIKDFKVKEIQELRLKEIGYIFQSFNLDETTTVENNIKIVLNTLNISMKEKDYLLIDVLKKLGIYNIRNNLVSKLSGGEKQRVAIARCLIKSPKVILADEPTGSLDFKNSKKIFKILKSISKDILVIVITHDDYFSSLYGNNILVLENENLKYIKNDNAHFPQTYKFINKNYKFNKELKFNYIFNKFISLFKYKKKSQLFLISMISFSLFTFGLTFTIKDEISNLIVSSFSSLCGENSLILEKNNNLEIFDYYSASKDDLINVYNFSKNIEEIGAQYLNNFNDFFIEENDIYLNNKYNSLIKINEINMNNFINYKYINNLNSMNIYPKNNSNNKINKDEIILGLNNQTMIELTNSLRIERTYESLGNYINLYNPYIIIKVRNDYWNYDDEVLLNLKGVVLSSSNEIISTSLFYNEYLLEDIMRFPSTLEFNKVYDEPWILKKVYYFKSKNKEEIIKKLSLSSMFNEFSYDSSFFEDKICLIYKIDNYLKESDLKLLDDYFDYKSYYYSTYSGYINYGSVLAGFSYPTFLSNNNFDLENIINNDLKFEDYYYIDSNSNFLSGNYLINDSKKLKLSSDYSSSIEGKYPSNYSEIAISKSIANKFNLKIKDKIFLSTFFDSDENINDNYKIYDFKVVGIVDDNNNNIYQDGYFSLNFYRDRMRVSTINLMIQNITIFLNEKIDKIAIEQFNSDNSEYKISAPLLEIENSLNESLSLILIILNVFSCFSFIISLILLIIISYIRFNDSKKESAILIILGFSNTQILKNNFYINLLTSFCGLLVSIVLLIFGNISVSFLIEKMIGGFSLLLINPIHIIYLFFLALIISILSSFFLILKIKSIDIKKELHH